MLGSFVRLSVGAAAMSLLMTGTSAATSLSLDYIGPASGYRTLTILEAPVDPIPGNPPVNVSAGAFELQDDTPNSAFGTFIAWCLDITHWLDTGGNAPYETTTTPFSSSFGITPMQLSRLRDYFDANYFEGLEDNVDRSAGFQMGAWESLYDDDFSLTDNTAATGEFRGQAGNIAANTAFGFATGYLFNAKTYNGPRKWNLIFLESLDPSTSYSQNLVTVAPVPLPAAGLLLLTGIAGLGFVARRRKG